MKTPGTKKNEIIKLPRRKKAGDALTDNEQQIFSCITNGSPGLALVRGRFHKMKCAVIAIIHEEMASSKDGRAGYLIQPLAVLLRSVDIEHLRDADGQRPLVPKVKLPKAKR
jgi:hypothetical protein